MDHQNVDQPDRGRRYFSKHPVQRADTLKKARVLPGRGYPLISHDRRANLEETGFKPQVVSGIFKDNARRRPRVLQEIRA